jgi:hypothetical protein
MYMNKPKKRVRECGLCGEPVRESLMYSISYTGKMWPMGETLPPTTVEEKDMRICLECYTRCGYKPQRGKRIYVNPSKLAPPQEFIPDIAGAPLTRPDK